MNWKFLNNTAVWAVALVALRVTATGADLKSNGLTALQLHDFKQAYDLFLGAVEDAKNRKDDKETADLLFYLGLCRQQEAQQLGSGEPAAGLLAEAAMYYNQALGLTSKPSSLLNNLAQIYIQQGKRDLAQATLLKAIGLADANQAFHMQNYADLLVAKGEWKEGCRFYALASWTQPDNAAISKKLADLCLEKEPALLGFYLWDMTGRGQVLQAEDLALTALEVPKFQREQKEELLAIVAFCLSRQTYDPRAFAESVTAKRLQGLREDESVGQGAGEILELHTPRSVTPPRFAWWRERFNRLPPARGLWPLEAFQELSRSLGNGYKTSRRDESAAYYLRLAVDINHMTPDIASLISLADLYARTNQHKALRDLMRANEEALFGGKALAYAEGKLNEIYQFHRALGSIYSHLKKWGSSSESTSAIFQLEHALDTARKSQDRPERKVIAIEPDLVERLATGYQETNQPAKAFTLRLDVAEEFQKADRNEAAAALLAPMDRASVPNKFKVRYDALKRKVESRSDSASIEKSSEKKSDIRVSVKSQSVDDHRQESRLTPQEVADIQKSLSEVLNKQQPGKNETKTINILSPKEVPKEVKEIELDGVHGRVVLEKNAKRFQVPFTVDSSSKEPRKRYVKP